LLCLFLMRNSFYEKQRFMKKQTPEYLLKAIFIAAC